MAKSFSPWPIVGAAAIVAVALGAAAMLFLPTDGPSSKVTVPTTTQAVVSPPPNTAIVDAPTPPAHPPLWVPPHDPNRPQKWSVNRRASTGKTAAGTSPAGATDTDADAEAEPVIVQCDVGGTWDDGTQVEVGADEEGDLGAGSVFGGRLMVTVASGAGSGTVTAPGGGKVRISWPDGTGLVPCTVLDPVPPTPDHPTPPTPDTVAERKADVDYLEAQFVDMQATRDALVAAGKPTGDLEHALAFMQSQLSDRRAALYSPPPPAP